MASALAPEEAAVGAMTIAVAQAVDVNRERTADEIEVYAKGHAIKPKTEGQKRYIDAILKNADTRDQTQHEFDVISACLGADRALAAAKRVAIEYV